eukprot:6402742-Heterocapsa_arctica.AAC.1
MSSVDRWNNFVRAHAPRLKAPNGAGISRRNKPSAGTRTAPGCVTDWRLPWDACFVGCPASTLGPS